MTRTALSAVISALGYAVVTLTVLPSQTVGLDSWLIVPAAVAGGAAAAITAPRSALAHAVLGALGTIVAIAMLAAVTLALQAVTSTSP